MIEQEVLGQLLTIRHCLATYRWLIKSLVKGDCSDAKTRPINISANSSDLEIYLLGLMSCSIIPILSSKVHTTSTCLAYYSVISLFNNNSIISVKFQKPIILKKNDISFSFKYELSMFDRLDIQPSMHEKLYNWVSCPKKLVNWPKVIATSKNLPFK